MCVFAINSMKTPFEKKDNCLYSRLVYVELMILKTSNVNPICNEICLDESLGSTQCVTALYSIVTSKAVQR